MNTIQHIELAATLSCGRCLITARREGIGVDAKNEVVSVIGEDGHPLRAHGAVTVADLNAIEAEIEARHFTVTRRFIATETVALDVMNGMDARFIIEHDGDTIQRILYAFGGGEVRPGSEQFTEAAEAFHIDRYWNMLEDSDVAGYARRCYA